MSTDTSVLSILPNLSIGVVCVLALAYITVKFLKALDDRADKHELAMRERETVLRSVESEVRTMLVSTLANATAALQENSKVLGRVVRHFDERK